MQVNKSLTFFDPFSIEEVNQFLTGESLREQVLFSPTKAKRVHHKGDRFYYHVEENNGTYAVSDFYPSVTTITKHGKNTDINLLKWYSSMKWDETRKILWYKRRYGTFLHIAQAELAAKMMEFKTNEVDISVEDLRLAFVEYAKINGLPWSWVNEFWSKLCKAMVSFRLFCIRFDVEFLLIEKTLFNSKDGYAGTVDYVVRIKDGERWKSNCKSGNKYELKKSENAVEKVVTIDCKSSYKGMFPDGALQLILLGKAVEANFNIKVAECWHYNPTDWRTAPDFNLEIANTHPEAQNVEHILAIAKNRIGSIDEQKYKTSISGYLHADNGFNFESITVREAIDAYESGHGIELGLAADRELEADNMAAKMLKELFIATY